MLLELWDVEPKMCIYGSENASPVGRAWYRPCSYRHQRRHALADGTTDQNIVTCPAAHGTNYAVVVVCVGGGGGEVRSGQLARGRWGQRSSAWGYMSGRTVRWGRPRARTLREWFAIHILLTLRSNRPAMEPSRTGWVELSLDEAFSMHFQHQNSNSFRFAIR